MTSSLPWPPLDARAHKGRAGRVLAVVGSRTMPGAAVLVARAAQRAGAGLVSVLCVDQTLLTSLPPAVPEAVWSDASAEFGADGSQSPSALARLAERSPHARLAGCGLGDDARTRAIVRALFSCEDDAPLILDADALNVSAGAPEDLQRARGALILTPHPGEAERLLGRSVPSDEAGRIEVARELARRTRSVVCLKGKGTVITDGERVGVNTTGNEGMATAGAGDVLAGILAAYFARAHAARVELDAFALASLGVRAHGLAGDRAAAQHGVDAVIASDLIERLGAVQRELRDAAGGAGAAAGDSSDGSSAADE